MKSISTILLNRNERKLLDWEAKHSYPVSRARILVFSNTMTWRELLYEVYR